MVPLFQHRHSSVHHVFPVVDETNSVVPSVVVSVVALMMQPLRVNPTTTQTSHVRMIMAVSPT